MSVRRLARACRVAALAAPRPAAPRHAAPLPRSARADTRGHMSNASLLASVKRAIDEPQVRRGTDALHLPGPDGTWRLAQYARSKHNRTYWTIKVTSPHGATFHSFSNLSQHLDQLGGDDESDPMEEDEEVDAADGDAADDDAADDALRLRAAVHLQEVRVRRFRAACREVAPARRRPLGARGRRRGDGRPRALPRGPSSSSCRSSPASPPPPRSAVALRPRPRVPRPPRAGRAGLGRARVPVRA